MIPLKKMLIVASLILAVFALGPAIFVTTGVAATATTLYLFTGNNQSGTVSQPLGSPFVVRVTDANYDPVAGVLVTFTVTAGGGSLSVTQASTNAQGQASTVLTLGPSAGRNTVTATSANLTGSSVTFTATGSLTSGTGLCGSLFDDTTWTRAQSPYIVTCSVTLFPGKTLTIEPGAVIRFNPGTGLVIRGTLNAVGRADDRITLNSVAAPSQWNGVALATNLGGKAVIAFTDFSYASIAVSVECCGGALVPARISDSSFRNTSVALGGYAGSGYEEIVTNSTFENNKTTIRNADKLIYDSVFRSNTYGLSQTERTSVYRSTFEGNEVALSGNGGVVQDCRISDNGTGVQGFNTSNLAVSRNSITGNGIGIVLFQDASAPVQGNNIFGNTPYNVKVTGAPNKLAPNNWWGTTDRAEIDAKILDGRDDASLGLLEYVPFLTSPAPEVPGINPPPNLISLSRSSGASGSPGFNLAVTGNNFTPTSVVRWNGDYRPTVYVNGAVLQASISAADLALPGTATVTVFSPPPGGGLSGALIFAITPGTPTLTSISPSTATVGGSGFTLTATGFGFVAGAVVRWNGANRPTTFVSSTQLQASIPPDDIASRGEALIAVAISASAAALPNAQRFTVTSPGGACFYSLTPPSRSYNSSGGTGGFEVFTSDDCTWPATTNATWIILTSNSSGKGNGAVFYSFTTNTSSNSRTGTITVAGQTFTVTQAGAPGSVAATAFEPRLVRNLAPGFYILEATLGPQSLGGFWGMEVITSLGQAAGGFNLGGGVAPAAASPGFGAFLLSGTQSVTATLNAQVSPGTLMTLRFLDSGKRPVGDPVTGVPPLTLSRSLDAGFYVVEAYSSGPAPFNFQLGLAADFFVGGVNTGGYLGPGNVGFGAFYVPEAQDVTMKLYGRSTYGSTGAGDLVLTLRDADRKVLATVSP